MKSSLLSPPHLAMSISESDLQSYDLVVFSHLRWDFVTQRPQHLIERFSMSSRVIFVEEPIAYTQENYGEVKKIVLSPNLVVLQPRMKLTDYPKLLTPFLQKLQKNAAQAPILWFYSPAFISMVESLDSSLVVYDCMDELSSFKGASPLLITQENSLLQKADLVFTGGKSLYEAKLKKHANVYCFPSSVDQRHFEKALFSNTKVPDEMSKIPSPIVGYYGVLDERLDWELIKSTAQLLPEVSFVFIGPLAKISETDLPREQNLYYLGQKAYEELPNYLKSFSVAFMPFVLNQATTFISPTKTLEFMAAQKPIVSTAIYDVARQYREQVKIISSPTTAAAAIRAYLSETPAATAIRSALQNQVVTATSWDTTAQEMVELMMSALEDRLEVVPTESEWPSLHNRNWSDFSELRSPNVPTITNLPNLPVVWSPLLSRKPADILIIGAGISGAVLAERYAASGKKVLIIEKRDHIAGNCYDYYNEAGILVSKYGAHLFHTNYDDVWKYVKRFGDWYKYEHKVLAKVDGQLVPVPVNIKTVNMLLGTNIRNKKQMKAWLAENQVKNAHPSNGQEAALARVGPILYEKIFKNYTKKQWDKYPEELDASVLNRIPVRSDFDDRYFSDTYQFLPKGGYTKLFKKMLIHPNIQILRNTDYFDVRDDLPEFEKVFYTGPIDQFFDFKFSLEEKLEYRSITFVHETLNQEFFQENSVVNYPNDEEFTRIVEYKHITGQKHPQTTIVKEYTSDEGEPYYPVPNPRNQAIYNRYKKEAEKLTNIYFVGRLANYKYFNMDQAFKNALDLFAKLQDTKQKSASAQDFSAASRAALSIPM